jgi:hypothetical protein
MRIIISTKLESKPEVIWEAVQSPQILEYIAAPLIVIEPLRPSKFPDKWSTGNFLVRLKFLGIIPLGFQWMQISIPKRKSFNTTLLYKIRDNGFGKLAKRWDHLITIKLLGDGKTQYTDQVDIEAGRWTLFLWLVSHLFLYHRQHRWQTLVKHHFEYVKIEVV